MNEATPLLEVDKLEKWYGDLEVLKEVNLRVWQKDVVSVIGRSGSGKSTMLRCLQLLEDFQVDNMLLDGDLFGFRRVNGELVKLRGKALARERAKVGTVFQNFNLFPHMTALQNVIEAPVQVKGLPRNEAIELARDLLSKMKLEGKEDAYPAGLSGGQQQRVAIARALAMNPRLMLFDEPTSALDPELVKGVLNAMATIAKEGMTMLVVTHEMPFALEVSNRTMFIDQGVVVEEGEPTQVLQRPDHPETKRFLQTIT